MRCTWLTFLVVATGLCSAWAGDWPTYRHDTARSGVTADRIQTPLFECWVFQPRRAPEPAWGDPKPDPVEGYLELRRIHFDDAFQVAVAGGAVYFGSSANGKLYCLDTATGGIRWTSLTDGPIRLAPTVAQGRVFVGSDDGYAYCLNAADGSLAWKFRAAPDDRRVLGSGKMISLWPLRSSVLVDDGVAYLAAGIFPAEGVFLYALDAADGSEIWRNDTCGEAPQSRISPQGYLLASTSTIYAPMARVSPAAFDRSNGKLKYVTYFGKSVGGTYALLAGEEVYTGTEEIVGYRGDTRDQFASFAGRRLVVSGDLAYVATGSELSALDRKAFPAAGRKLKSLEARKASIDVEIRQRPSDELKQKAAELVGQIDQAQREFAATTLWKLPCQCEDSLILAGDVLLAGGVDEVVAVQAASGKVLWTGKLEGTAKGLAVAADRLFVSTDKGLIYCFGAEGSPQTGAVVEKVDANPFANSPLASKFSQAAEEIIDSAGIKRGYCLVAGLETGQLALELAKRSELMVYAVDPDADKVAAARRAIDAAGLQGSQVCVEQHSLDNMPYSDYFANLVVSETAIVSGKSVLDSDEIARMTKPLGGITITPQGKTVRGPLSGAGSWTHLYANPSNTACGDDQIVKCPLGVLWFGRPGPGSMVNRHRRAAGPLSIDGRVFVQGENVVMAYDVYNGMELWRREIPGAMRVNASGDSSNLALSREGLFVAIGKDCLRLNLDTGEIEATYTLPPTDNGKSGRWGYVATIGKRLYGTRCPGGNQSDLVFCLDVESGEPRWVFAGKNIPHISVSIGDGRVFLIDGSVDAEQRQQAIDEQRKRIAAFPESERAAALAALDDADVRMLHALDAETGDVKWRQAIDLTHCGGGNMASMYNQGVLVIFGVYLDGHYWRQFFSGEFASRRVTALAGKDGEFLWSQPVGYRVRPLIIGDTLHTEPWAFDLHTGRPRTRVHPVTGQTDRWQFARPGHHCGLPIGSPNCLFFRSYNLGYYDLLGDYGTMHFGAQRPGCWINFLPAGGLLLFPEASAGCMCPFPIMCSVVFQPVSENKAYSYYSAPGSMTPVKRLAINLGAAGDRSDSAGKLWLGYPRPGGSLVLQFKLGVAFHPRGTFEGRNSAYTPITQTDDPWLFTSAARGLKKCVVPLLEKGDGTALYTVKLAFADPDNDQPGARVFDVKLQDQIVLENFDIADAAGGRDRAVVKEFTGVRVEDELVVELVPKTARHTEPERTPILQGLEVERERVVSLGCAVPDFLLSSLAAEQSGELRVRSLQEDSFAGTLRIIAPEGFQVASQKANLELASGEGVTIPLTVSVGENVPAGNYPLVVKLLRTDGTLELERTSTIEHLGRRGRLVVEAIEDAYVRQRYPDLNKGTDTKMFVDGGDQRMGDPDHSIAYLKFPLDLPGKAVSVTFRIYNAGNPTGNSGRICLVNGPWSETELTYDTQPELGPELVQIGNVIENQVVQCKLDVDLNGKSELSLVLDPTTCDGVDYLSRESDKPAELVIEYEQPE